jgi:hypothetical protein
MARCDMDVDRSHPSGRCCRPPATHRNPQAPPPPRGCPQFRRTDGRSRADGGSRLFDISEPSANEARP